MKKYVCQIVSFILFINIVHANKIHVSSITSFENAIKKATAGDTIVLKNGIWNNVNFHISCSGTLNQPIVIQAETIGKVSITGESSLKIGGDFIVVEGLIFNNGFATKGNNIWEFKLKNQVANYSRITNCTIVNFSNTNRLTDNYWVALYGKHNRIDHCKFGNKLNIGVLVAVILEDERSRNNYHSIDNNHFTERTPLASNGGEIIRVGVSQHCTFYSNTIIKDNLFTNCDGETEIISIKSCGNVVRNNVFKACQGTVVLRHGNNNTIEGNIFLGNGKKGTGGTRIINEGNWVINNIFFECRGENFRSPLAIMNGVFNSPPNRYLPVKDAIVAFNTYINCSSFSLGEGSDTERSVAPKQVYFFNNLFVNSKDSILYKAYDKIDSIYFKNNIVSNTIKQNLTDGFKSAITSTFKLDKNIFKATDAKEILPDSLYQQIKERLQYKLPNTVGSNRYNAFKNTQLTLVSKKQPLNPKTNNVTIQCKTANEIYAALSLTEKTVTIVLTENNYTFNKSLLIQKNITIQALKTLGVINFITNDYLPTLIYVQAGATLALQNMQINANGMNTSYFMLSDSTEKAEHYSIKYAAINIQNYGSINKGIAFFKASKSSVADSIVVQNCTFKNNHSNLFLLNQELDNKGYYNVENTTFLNNSFLQNTGSIINLYRGGNDESTMGPMLLFSKNIISGCNSNNALITLEGVQQSTIVNNQFIQANYNQTCIKYTDYVRANHVLKNNNFISSGIILPNKYVVSQ